jgi:hypothetical protein
MTIQGSGLRSSVENSEARKSGSAVERHLQRGE